MKTNLVFPVLFTSSFLAAQGEVKVPRLPVTQAPVKTAEAMPPPAAPPQELFGGSALPRRTNKATAVAGEARRIGRAYDQSQDGTLFVATDDWKASFDQKGPTFVPFLGSDAEQNYPASFHLQKVTIGGEEQVQGNVQPVRSGDVVSYQRAAVTEA